MKNQAITIISLSFIFALGVLGFGGSVKAACDYCSEPDCSNYLLCENFDVGGIPTNWHCDSHTDFNCDSCSEHDYWHDLGILGGHTDCSIWYGKVTANYGIDGTNCFESNVTSVADCQGYGGPNCTTAPACNGCHGGGFKAWVSEDPLPTELWVRWYIYIPSTNYPNGDGPNYWHCNHHVFLSDGAGANPCINIKHVKNTPWTPDAGDSDGHLYISVGSNGIGESNTEGIADFVLDDHFDEWISIEWYLNDIAQQTSLWINGVKYVDSFPLSWTKNMDGFLIGQYNCGNDDVGTTWKMYIDNVVVSTTGYIGPAESSVIFEEDFEYGQIASHCSECSSLPGWKWNYCQDEGINSNANGYVNVVSSLNDSSSCHEGSYCLEIDYSPQGSQPNPYSNSYVQLDSSDFDNDVWIQAWFNFQLKESDPNGWWGTCSSGNKLIYANDADGQAWVIVFKGNYVTTDTCFAACESIIEDDKLSYTYIGFGGATRPSGQNENNTHLVTESVWHKVIIHISMALANTPHVEMWLDNNDGNGLVKIAEHTYDNDSQCKTWRGSVSSVLSLIRFGTTCADDAYVYIDEVKVANSINDMDWGVTGDVTGDDSVDITDVQACVNHILGTQDWGSAADVNGDEAVNVLDVQEIVNIILSG